MHTIALVRMMPYSVGNRACCVSYWGRTKGVANATLVLNLPYLRATQIDSLQACMSQMKGSES
jgi:hypothetical protein